MKAAILEKLNAPLIVEELEVPALECGQVLVKVHASGVCGKQIGEINGHYGEDKFLPHLLGHEGGGIVIKIGEGVMQVKPGDHVAMHWRIGAGIEANFPKYKSSNGVVGAGKITTFSDFSIVSENRLTRIDEDIPFEIAALMGCAVTTALGLINNEAKLKIGQSIAVIGCGGIGLNIIQGAAMVSAYPIVAIDIYDSKLEMAREFGATHYCLMGDLSQEDLGSYDIVVDCTGKVECIEKAYKLTASGGKTIMVGQPHCDHDLALYSMANNFIGKILMDSQGGQTNPPEDIPRYLRLYQQGKLRLDSLITHKYPLDKVNEAVETVKNGKAGRVILEM